MCPYIKLLIAGPLPAGSELTFGFPMLSGFAVSPPCVKSTPVDLHLSSRKSVLITNLPWHQLGVTSKPDESLAAGAGALPQPLLQGERKSEHTEQSLSVALGPKELVPLKNRKEISSYSGKE